MEWFHPVSSPASQRLVHAPVISSLAQLSQKPHRLDDPPLAGVAMKHVIGVTSLVFALVVSSWAQQPAAPAGADNSALEQHIRDLEDRIIALEGQVRMLKAQGSAPAATPSPSAEAVAASAPANPSPST